MSEITHISGLTPDPTNRRLHGTKNAGMMVNALHEVGFARSIVVDEAGVILAGNGIVEAAAEAGIERVQVVEADGETIVAVRRTGLTPEQKTRLALFDNRAAELAEWDLEQLTRDLAETPDLLAGLWQEEELAELLAGVNTPPPTLNGDPDAVPPTAPAICQPGDLWELGPHRLLCGDATKREEVERLMGGERADCVATSPPYAVGVDYGEYEDTIENLRSMLPTLAASWQSILQPGGFAVVNFGDVAPARNIAKVDEPCEYPMALEYWPPFREAGFTLWARRVWCKPNARVHSPWVIQTNRAATDWEHVWTWKKKGAAIVDRVLGEYGSQHGWFTSEGQEGVEVGKDEHGAGMAAVTACWMVALHSRPGRIVYEPFCGTGTTIVGCEQLRRKCRAIELEPRTCDIALERYSRLTGNAPRRLAGAGG